MVQPTYKTFETATLAEPAVMNGRWAKAWETAKGLKLDSPKWFVFEFADAKDTFRLITSLNAYCKRYNVKAEGWQLKMTIRQGNLLYVKRVHC